MMKKASIVAFIGLVLVSHAVAEPLLEGQVRLSSGEAAVAAQVMVFDLTNLQRGPVAQVTTDANGHFALPLASLDGQALPQGFALGQNYPNPFNPSTVIPYQLPTAAHVRLEVFNVLGQHLATLVDGERPAGVHTAVWDATDAAGQAVAAGVYIYRLHSAGMELTRRMVLVDGQAGTAATTLPVLGGESLESTVGETSEPAEQTYGLVVSGAGVVPYVDVAFEVRAGMAPVEFVVESVENLPRGKALTCGILGDVNNDGQVDLADALLVVVFNFDPSIMAPNNGNIGLGDVTDDGTVNLADLLAIMTYITNPTDTSLPTGIGQTSTRVNWVAGPIRRLTNDAGVAYDANLVWSPSGRYIYFNAEIDSDFGISRVATEADWYGSYEVVQVSKHSNLAWSPSGRYVAFDFEEDGNRDIYVLDRETDAVRRLTNNSESDWAPAWSPDGTQIAFVSDRNGNWDIYVMDADGEDEYLRRLTNNDDYDANPTWSPDGSQIAFQSNRAGDWDIYVMDADGSNLRSLAYTYNYEGYPAWSPDGQKIAFVS
ncbi:MAG: T9SS type A sorting domain-containing protein, partial [Gemmatimonadetes bacterium]|nr:T9SS type A sorting domain-containing protein [Gemmatimonadota bacterium]